MCACFSAAIADIRSCSDCEGRASATGSAAGKDRRQEYLRSLLHDGGGRPRISLRSVQLTEQEAGIAERLLQEIRERLRFLNEVGLEYLTLDRLASTLSGGEAQRIQLATSLGSRLVGTLYVLDEPSIGLHSRDTHRLIKILHDLRDLGNTILVVEHDRDVMRASDRFSILVRARAKTGARLIATWNVRSNSADAGFAHRALSFG